MRKTGMSFGTLEYLQRPEVGTHFKAGALAVWEHKHILRHHNKHIKAAKALTVTRHKRKKRKRWRSRHRNVGFCLSNALLHKERHQRQREERRLELLLQSDNNDKARVQRALKEKYNMHIKEAENVLNEMKLYSKTMEISAARESKLNHAHVRLSPIKTSIGSPQLERNRRKRRRRRGKKCHRRRYGAERTNHRCTPWNDNTSPPPLPRITKTSAPNSIAKSRRQQEKVQRRVEAMRNGTDGSERRKKSKRLSRRGRRGHAALRELFGKLELRQTMPQESLSISEEGENKNVYMHADSTVGGGEVGEDSEANLSNELDRKLSFGTISDDALSDISNESDDGIGNGDQTVNISQEDTVAKDGYKMIAHEEDVGQIESLQTEADDAWSEISNEVEITDPQVAAGLCAEDDSAELGNEISLGK